MILDAVRRRLEEREESLSPYAMKSRLSRGRLHPEKPSLTRTEFQRDRDRIIHAKAFRRLKHKTQVFIAPLGDHYVTRLTHTLEVSQIARSIARALNLNEDLAEAISLGHDLGHTPFGHVGEEVLNSLYPEGFRHHEQSRRVVDILENEGQGLNLTWEVRQGILGHTKGWSPIQGEGWGTSETLEAEVCKLADLIAYINHDIGDALRAGLIQESELPTLALEILGRSSSERINTLVCDIIEYSWGASGAGGSPIIGMSPPVREAAESLRWFLQEKLYVPRLAERETGKAQQALRFLYAYFTEKGGQLPPEGGQRGESRERQAVDYIAGMTDQFALRLAEELGWVYR